MNIFTLFWLIVFFSEGKDNYSMFQTDFKLGYLTFDGTLFMLRFLSINLGFCLLDILHSSCKYSQFLCFCKTYFEKKVISCLTFF